MSEQKVIINAIAPTCIKGEELQEWLEAEIAAVLPGKLPYIIHRPWEARGESRFFSEINLDKEITIDELIKREVVEHARGEYIHFYADDVVAAACGSGALSGRWFWLYHTW